MTVSLLAAERSVAGRAEVRAVVGTAAYFTNGGPVRPLREGMVLRSGSTITTAGSSTVDLFLGNSAGVIRLAENSTISLDQLLLKPTGADTVVDVQLNLPDGEMYFNVNKLSKGSRYEIKMPNGVAGIRGTKGSFSSKQVGNLKPPVVVLTGTVTFAHVDANGQITIHTLNTPPPKFFTAAGGVQTAPPDLVNAVNQQVESFVFGGTGSPPNRQIEPFISPNH